MCDLSSNYKKVFSQNLIVAQTHLPLQVVRKQACILAKF